jgi:acyl-coenzyme A thioesterase PaaI-like protein
MAPSSQSRPSAITDSRPRRHAIPNTACFACGQDNAAGLRLRFEVSKESAEAEWTPVRSWESFQGVIHGGIVATVLDEAMSKAIAGRHWEALTAELRVRLRGRVVPGEPLRVRGWVVERRRRMILAEASLAGSAGAERAHAWATFLVPPAAAIG